MFCQRPLGRIGIYLAQTGFQDGNHQIIWTKHVLPLKPPADIILRKIKEHGTHDGFAGFVGALHQLAHIGTKFLSQRQVLFTMA